MQKLNTSTDVVLPLLSIGVTSFATVTAISLPFNIVETYAAFIRLGGVKPEDTLLIVFFCWVFVTVSLAMAYVTIDSVVKFVQNIVEKLRRDK